MPPREPKSRLMVREYFQDFDFMTQHTAQEREFYMGLAQLADDSGWMAWSIPEVGASLYRFEDPKERAQSVAAMALRLQQAGRLKVFKCGHASLPKVAARPRAGGRDYAVQDQHRERCQHRKGLTNGQPESTEVDSGPLRQPVHSSPILTSAGPGPRTNRVVLTERERARETAERIRQSAASAVKRVPG
jgi:hypothetical protein